MTNHREALNNVMLRLKKLESEIDDDLQAHELWNIRHELWQLDSQLWGEQAGKDLDARRRQGEEDLLISEWEFAFFLAQPHLRRYQGR